MSLSEEEKNDFVWFDSLGFPDITKYPLVDVISDNCISVDNGKPQPTTITGFLITEDSKSFTFFSYELQNEIVIKTPAKESCHQHYRVLDLKATSEQFLRSVRDIKSNDDFFSQSFFFSPRRINKQMEAFLLARLCFDKGNIKLTEELFKESKKLSVLENREDKPKSYEQSLSDELALLTIWKNTLDFGDVEISRDELLKEFLAFIKHFPNSEFQQDALEKIRLLKQMIDEDQHHGVRILSQMNKRKKISELIFLLRDQNGEQLSQPGSCDVFMDPRGKDSPASQLVKIGFPAVPQLINALDDVRFTRSVGFWRNFTYSHHVLRIGDAAEQILSEITKKHFYEKTYTNAQMIKDGKEETVKQQYQEWWKSQSDKSNNSQ